jgi:hypothetical protein
MPRRLLNLLTLLSLLLCATATTAWVCGRHRVVRVAGAAGRFECSAAAARGNVYCFFSPDPGRIYRRPFDVHALGMRREFDIPLSRASVRRDEDVLPDQRVLARAWGLGITTCRGKCGPCVVDIPDMACNPPRWTTWTVASAPPNHARGFARYRRYWAAAVPLWLPACLFATTGAAGLRTAARARRRVSAGLCHRCGYDLRATPERCPECGTPARAPTAA